jgi:O-antigen/teichoic acid export membrane protein
MSKYKSLGKNTVLVFIGNAGSKLIGLLMLPFYTKWLSVEDYGVTDIITIYAAFLLGIITCCITDAIFIFPKDVSKEKQRNYFSSGLFFAVLCFLVAAGLFIVAKLIFNIVGISNSFTKYSWIIYLIILGTFIQNYLQQFSRSIGKVKVYAISGLLLTVFSAVLAFVLIPMYGFMGFIAAQVISSLLASLYTFIFSKSISFFSFSAIKKESYREMLLYSIPLIPNGIMWGLVSALNRPIIEHYSSMNEVGLFAVANKFPALLIMVFSIFIFSWQISVLEEFNNEGYKLFYNKVLRVIFIVLTFLSCGLTIFSKLIITVMADDKFIEAWRLVPILTIAVLFSSLSGFVGTNFSATRESKYFFYSSVWGAIASVLFNFLLIPSFGLFGAAMAVVLSFAIMAFSRIVYSWKHVKITNLHTYGFMIVINVLVVLATFYIDNIALRSLVYLVLFLVFIIVNKNMKGDLIAAYLLVKAKMNKKDNEKNS